ncbi:MAG: hypothetical protein IBX50_14710 [Marinospirillum sp.]|nr:hypothetical protein [Marinospirillum sp.]
MLSGECYDSKSKDHSQTHDSDQPVLINGNQLVAAVRTILLPLYGERQRVNGVATDLQAKASQIP